MRIISIVLIPILASCGVARQAGTFASASSGEPVTIETYRVNAQDGTLAVTLAGGVPSAELSVVRDDASVGDSLVKLTLIGVLLTNPTSSSQSVTLSLATFTSVTENKPFILTNTIINRE